MFFPSSAHASGVTWATSALAQMPGRQSMERRTAGPARRARIRSGRRKVSLNIDIAIGIANSVSSWLHSRATTFFKEHIFAASR